MLNIEEANRKSKEAVDGVLKSYSEVAKSWQAIATETGEFSRKYMQDATSYFEQLMGVRTIEAALELQTNFAKSSYETAVAQTSKLTELYSELGKTLVKPLEAAASQSTSVFTKTTL
ncbi:phasin family protein [Rhizobium sp. Root149]|jgi:phasin family protein|uniref:phasin family protein n=1 Tax=Rhizobium sp. Root149 TaxID=1736473 RepID=UPI000713B1C1|nr:phasin family protein [Rhizobium sp. Root149]KQZ54921.1 phasin family protein [Rhizobium sp. Root149]